MRRLLATAAALGLVAAGCAGREEPRALLLLATVDTLRADHLGAYGSDRGLTPNLDALARESLVFDAAYAPAPFTLPSLAALLTGRHPLELGLRINLSKLPGGATTLAETFSEAGWRTAAVVSNVVLRDRDDVARGFEIYDDEMLQREATRPFPERIASHTTDAALRIVEAWRAEDHGRPLFLWVHYQDPHGPYTPPAGWRERYLALERDRVGDLRLPVSEDSFGAGAIPRYQYLEGENEVAFYRAGYDAEIAFMDRELGRLLDALRARGLLSSVVFAADHGEALGEAGLWFAHGNDLTDALVRVPLFLRLPGVAPGRRGDVASLLDVLPTLLRATLGAAPPGLPGRDLLAPGAQRRDSVPLLSTLGSHPRPRTGIVADDYKLILTLRDGVWGSRLHRRGREEVDLAAPAPHLATRLRERLWSLHERLDTASAAPVRTPTEQERRDLEALGYLHPEAR